MWGRRLQPVSVDSTLFWLQLKAFGVLPQSIVVLALLHKVIPLLFQTTKPDFCSSLWMTKWWSLLTDMCHMFKKSPLFYCKKHKSLEMNMFDGSEPCQHSASVKTQRKRSSAWFKVIASGNRDLMASEQWWLIYVTYRTFALFSG